MAKYIQIGVVSTRNIKTGQFEKSYPVYVESTSEMEQEVKNNQKSYGMYLNQALNQEKAK